MNKGFTVAVGLLESQLQELRRKTLFYRDENRMIANRQEYEVQALSEIAGNYPQIKQLDERRLTVERLEDEYSKQKQKFNWDHQHQMMKIKQENESKIWVINSNHEEGKYGMIK